MGALKSLNRAELSYCDEADSFLQSGFWGSFKARFGWEAHAFRAEWESAETEIIIKPLLVLYRKITFGFSLAYIPWGPELPAGLISEKAINDLAISLKKELPKNTVFIRFDFPYLNEESAFSFLNKPFIRSLVDIQAPNSVVIDLTQPIEVIKANMKAKWRYNVNLAFKRGVIVSESEKIDAFYEILKETAIRDGIYIHSIDYYKTLFEMSSINGKKADIRLYIAEHEGDLISAVIIIFHGKKAVYLYGASSSLKRNLMAPYALQFKAITDAKEEGFAEYDFFGIPPNENPSHPLAGLYRFKTGFGGKIITRLGAWDFPVKKYFYFIYHFAEYIRKKFMMLKKLAN